jgi:hypothetical protein
MEKQFKVQVALRDDPLMNRDEFRVLSAGSGQDLTAKYAPEQ